MTKVSTDPIADMLTRIRNAIASGKTEVVLPHSNIKHEVAKILVECGFILNVAVDKDNYGKTLLITINDESSNPKITEIVRMSKPGRRMYVNSKEIPTVKRGRGAIIISTSKGLMTGDKAKSQHIGGELICKVY